jgi:hypothetical protein
VYNAHSKRDVSVLHVGMYLYIYCCLQLVCFTWTLCDVSVSHGLYVM